VAPYLALCPEDARQRGQSLRAVFNGLRYIVKGNQWRMMMMGPRLREVSAIPSDIHRGQSEKRIVSAVSGSC
jgi:hypothetical protein